jgi:ribonuclease R
MTTMSRLPTKAEVLGWISDNPTSTSKRDIARAFGLKGAERVELKRVLRELQEEGHLEKRRRTYRDPDSLPPVTVLEVRPTEEGDLHARPLEWHGEGDAPVILVIPRASDPALGPGDRILAKLQKVQGDEHHYEARLIRRIGNAPRRLLGVFRAGSEGGRVVPIDKGESREWQVPPGATGGARDGELVQAEAQGPRGARMGLPRARIVERLGDPSAPRSVSLIAIHQHGIPDEFPDEALEEAEAEEPAGLAGREDLRGMPLVTIDPEDARDHDDAVWAEPDGDGHVLWVAIADVAHAVRPGTALDREAWRRGNSTYFPDRVVPMLPERLSGDLCSLHEGVPRAVIAVRMTVDAEGELTGQRFVRGLMRSAASLTYEEVQAAFDGAPSDRAAPLLDPVIRPLYAAYAALRRARARREPLELDLPERRIVLGADGRVESVAFRERLDAHRLIEEFMVTANVAAARELERRRTPLLYRVHEEPAPERLEALRETAAASGLTLAKGQVLRTAALNRLLDQAAGTADAELLSIATLRSMQQAYYAPDNLGHFGLALPRYAHFTSPIRRYADLVVHRALVRAHGWGPASGKEGLTPGEEDRLDETAEHISETERRSMAAERDTTDRYLAAYLQGRIGAEFEGRISGVQRFGLFVKLHETGADGLVPIGSIGAEYWHHDREAQTLMGSESGRVIGIGEPVRVRLADAVPVTGGLLFDLLEIAGEAVRAGPGSRRPGPRRRPAGPRPAPERPRKVLRRRR